MTDQPDPTRCGATAQLLLRTVVCIREPHPAEAWHMDADGCTWTDRTPPAAPTTGDPYDTDLGDFAMTADQEIRARALRSAQLHLAATEETPDWLHDGDQAVPVVVLDLADLYAAYIRDGRYDGARP